VLLDDILQSDDFEQYFSGLFDNNELQRRLRLGYQFAKTLHLLWSQFKFLHGDIKAKSFWIHKEKPLTALIDFDGGHFRQNTVQSIVGNIKQIISNTPPIMGENQEWLAPEIMKEVDIGSTQAKLSVTESSDYWAFNVGLFQLISGLPPFSHLNEHSYGACVDYYKNYEWPYYELSDKRFKSSEILNVYKSVLEHLNQYKLLFECWIRTLNEGFLKKNKRTDYNEWITILYDSILEKKTFIKIEPSTKYILEGDLLTFSWETLDGFVYFQGIRRNNIDSESIAVSTHPQLLISNEFGKWSIDVPVEIVKRVNVSKCVLTEPKVKIGESAKIIWNATGVEAIYFIRQHSNQKIENDFIEFVPEAGDVVKVVFESKYNLERKEFSLMPIVVSPVQIEYFKSDRLFIAETMPITISWSVQNADFVEISDFRNQVEQYGTIQIRPKSSQEIILKAKNDFFEDNKSVYVDVMPVPKINVNIPELPKLNISTPSIFNQIPTIYSKADMLKKRLNDILKK
jgi:serine/threonine protein kinase